MGRTKCSSSCVMTPSPHFCRNSPEVYLKTGKTPLFPHTSSLNRQFLAGGVITKIRQVTHRCLVGDFSTRLRLARNDKSESARNDRDMTHTLRTPIGSSGEEGEIRLGSARQVALHPSHRSAAGPSLSRGRGRPRHPNLSLLSGGPYGCS